jgi:hypothetical protein
VKWIELLSSAELSWLNLTELLSSVELSWLNLTELLISPELSWLNWTQTDWHKLNIMSSAPFCNTNRNVRSANQVRCEYKTVGTVSCGWNQPASELDKEIAPRSWALLQQLTAFLLLKKYLSFQKTERFIAAFTRACHLSLSWARLTQSTPFPNRCLISSYIIPSNPRLLSFPNGSFLQVFALTNFMYSSFPHSCHMTCPSHFP